MKNGIQKIVLFSVIGFLFTSCFPYREIQRNSKILSEYNKYYVNDSLQFSYAYPSDYFPIERRIDIWKMMRKSKIHMHSKYCLAAYKATDPYLEHYLFYFPNKKTALRELHKTFTSASATSFPSDSLYSDSLNHTLLKIIPMSKGIVGILGRGADSTLINLKPEFNDFVFRNIKQGAGYDKINFSNPYTLVEGMDMDRDSVVNYLAPMEKLLASEENYRKQDRFSYVQARNTYCSFITNNNQQKNYLLKWRNNYKNKNKLSYSFKNDEALKYLLDQCKNEQIVMFNENHFAPNNRLLVYLLLEDLWKQGFRYFGLEALFEMDSLLSQRGFVATESGFYTREPLMSNLIHKALKLGFEIFAYDSFSAQREKDQAQNIFQQTFQNDPTAKVVILAGFEHIAEKNKNRMAQVFRELYKIDPLTMNQSEFYTDSEAWLAVIDTASVPRKKHILSDIYLDNNLDFESVVKREKHHSYTFNIPFEKVKINESEDYIINVYRKSDYESNLRTIPAYNFLVEKNAFPNGLLFPEGDYVFTIRDVVNRVLFFGEMK